ncbi:DedA family protein [Humibacter sp. RRB41]|uniref:DedA family protein n=1 Tax=Humibacter sp. RRB41 TaxID=2919946 RepID=UPI001FAB1C5F|nr:VTT domain-containing protein [Humibacter sp. RRB41]
MLTLSALHASAVSVAYAGWLESVGPWLLVIVAAFVLIETGLLFPFLPGDTLLFAAAIMAGSAGIPIPVLIAVAAVAGIAGDQIGYAIGRRFGRGLFKDDARILKTKYLLRTDAFFSKYGPFAIVLARFAPIVRTFVPPLAGASTMRYRVFLVWNVVGGIAWSTVICLAGLLLGKIPFVGSNLDVISVAILLLSLAPFGVSYLRGRRRSRRAQPETETEADTATEREPAPLP